MYHFEWIPKYRHQVFVEPYRSELKGIMSKHAQLTERTGVAVYFCDPHSPWQRGLNENTNGLLRQYLSKGADLSVYTQEQLDVIAGSLNTRPRKSLGFRSPVEAYT